MYVSTGVSTETRAAVARVRMLSCVNVLRWPRCGPPHPPAPLRMLSFVMVFSRRQRLAREAEQPVRTATAAEVQPPPEQRLVIEAERVRDIEDALNRGPNNVWAKFLSRSNYLQDLADDGQP